MIATESRIPEETGFGPVAAKKTRTESCSTESNLAIETSAMRNLEIEGIKELFMDYDLLEAEDVACVICGKHYKSRVCVKKHLWEHSIYWDLFDGLKKQQRVLSIQAAIILAIRSNPSLAVLLVTSSSTGTKRKVEKMPTDRATSVINHRKRKLLSGSESDLAEFTDSSSRICPERFCPSPARNCDKALEGADSRSGTSPCISPFHSARDDTLFPCRTFTA